MAPRSLAASSHHGAATSATAQPVLRSSEGEPECATLTILATEDRVERYRQATEVRAAELGSHFDDVVLGA